MAFYIFISLFSLVVLLIIHELGHFVLAKKFGVKVEEFGLGYPPRLFGKKIGETLYSLNLLPFGAFVKIYGEEERSDDSRSFNTKPIWQRALIISGGVMSFWIASAIILSFVMMLGAPVAIDDEEIHNLKDPKVQIISVSSDSPAGIAEIRAGDVIKQIIINDQELTINKVKEVQEITDSHKGEEIILTIERGPEVFDVTLVPRISPPAGEGAMGIGLTRTATKFYPWYKAPVEGILETFNLTLAITKGLAGMAGSIISGKGMPSGVQIAGPIGIFGLFTQMAQLGFSYFLRFIAVISIYLAVFNILPIPALDGGKLLFLLIEKIKGSPVNEKLEQSIHLSFFVLLILLMVFVTIKFDIPRVF
ncbi:RIP metalloprotease [Patescibacteria group bacterium]